MAEFLDRIITKDLDRMTTDVSSVVGAKEVRIVTSDYTIQEGVDFHIVIDASSNSVTVTTPLNPKTGVGYNIACRNDDNGADIDFNGEAFYASLVNEPIYVAENISTVYDGAEWVGS